MSTWNAKIKTLNELRFEANKVKLQLDSLYNAISEIEPNSINLDRTAIHLYNDDNDTFLKVLNQLENIHHLSYEVKSNMSRLTKNHYESCLEQEIQ